MFWEHGKTDTGTMCDSQGQQKALIWNLYFFHVVMGCITPVSGSSKEFA